MRARTLGLALALGSSAPALAHAATWDTNALVQVELYDAKNEFYGSITGFAVHREGLVLSSANVFRGFDPETHHVGVRRIDPDTGTLGAKLTEAQFAAGSQELDVVVLHVPGIASETLPILPLGKAAELQLLSPVTTACFADAARSISMFSGNIASLPEQPMFTGEIRPGCSGAPVVDEKGRVVGLCHSAGRGVTIFTRIEPIRALVEGIVKIEDPPAPAAAPMSLWSRWNELDGAVKGVTGVAAAYLLLVALMLLMWIAVPSKLAEWAMIDETATAKPGWRWLGEALALVRWLGASDRALDAWLRRNDATLFARAFSERPAVERRRTYVDLGNDRDVAEVEERAGANAQTAVWISGPGGCGKSTLAMEMARRARAAAKRRPLVPVLVDKGWGSESEMESSLSVPLRIGSKKPDPSMLRKMAANGRLLMVVDGVSELDVTSKQVGELARTGAIRHLLVTSREPVVEGAGFRPVAVGPLEGERLSTFVRRYGAEESVATSLRQWTRGRPIRPLLARVAIEQLRSGELLPESFPDLVVAYVRALRTRGAGALREDDFLRAARLAARLCVEEQLAPRTMSGDFFRGHADAASGTLKFTGEAGETVSSAQVLDQLLKSGLLVRTFELTESRIRFADDPVAEYLFVLDVALKGPAAIDALRKRLAGSGGVAEALEEVAPLQQQA